MYYLTVERCNDGKRGIFCTQDGGCFRQETQHTLSEISNILGAFELVLSPKSEQIDDLTKFNRWQPLGEYSNVYGIAFVQK